MHLMPRTWRPQGPLPLLLCLLLWTVLSVLALPAVAQPVLTRAAEGELVLVAHDAVNLDEVDGLAFDGRGNLFAALEMEGEGGGLVFIDRASGVVVPLVTGIPRADQVAFHPSGDLYLTSEVREGDTTNRVYRITVTYDANGVPTGASSSPLNTTIPINNPEGLTVLDQTSPYGAVGDLVVAEDIADGQIVHVTPDGEATVLTGVVAGLARPEGMAFGDFGGALAPALYVAETDRNRVLRIDPQGTVSVLGDPEAFGLRSPDNVEFGWDGHLYVTEDRSSGRVIRIAPDGTHEVVATGFNYPQGLAFDPANGDLYIGEQNRSTVHAVRWSSQYRAAHASVLLYDDGVPGLPDAQPWLVYFDDAFGCAADDCPGRTDVPEGVTLVTDGPTSAGFGSHLFIFRKNTAFPVLDRGEGFEIRFQLRLDSESHGSAHRAGFSLIAISQDLQGIELGFWLDEIWAQSGPAFTHAEGAAFDTTSAEVAYRLVVSGDGYSLHADGTVILQGPLRSYSDFGVPYDLPSFLFLGDDTGSAGAEATIGKIAVWTTGSAEMDTDTDGDGIADAVDPDDDGDGVPDAHDSAPLDAGAAGDPDGDGEDSLLDDDDDGDGSPDVVDAFPWDPTEDTDTDGDGTGNEADLDDDGDGTPDTDDAFPLDATEDRDTDGDGLGDNLETDRGLDPRDARDARRDADGDDFSNAEEIAHGTDLNDANDWPMPSMTTPRQLTGHTDLFEWEFPPGLTVDRWRVRVGNTAGGRQILRGAVLPGARRRLQVLDLPTRGAPVFVTLSLDRGRGFRRSRLFVFDAALLPPPVIVSPAPGGPLGTGTVDLVLDLGGHEVTRLRVTGGTAPGARDLFRTPTLRVVPGSDAVTIPVTVGSPVPGGPVYLRVLYRVGKGAFQSIDAVYERPTGVVPVYPGNGSWNDYVRRDGADDFDASGRACRSNERDAGACLHGGERLQFILPRGVTACEGITASDVLDAFQWACREDTQPPRIVSTGLADGARLTDLLDTTVPAWRPNHLEVTGIAGGPDPLATEDAVWWSNPVLPVPADGVLSRPGTVYVAVDAAALSAAVSARRTRGVALVIPDGQTLTGGAARGGAAVDLSRVAFAWLEGVIDATGASRGIVLDRVNSSRLNAMRITGAGQGLQGQEGRPASGVHLSRSHGNRLTGIRVMGARGDGFSLERSNGNVLHRTVAVANGRDGVVLHRARGNRIRALRAAANARHGVRLERAADSLLHEVTAHGNGVPGSPEGAGVAVMSGASQRNDLIGLYTFANAGDGVAVTGGTRSLIRYLTSASNGGNGLLLSGAKDVTADSAVTVNNGAHGIALAAGATRNVVKDVVSAHNGGAVPGLGAGLSLSGRSRRNLVQGQLAFGGNVEGACRVEGRSGDVLDGTCLNERGEQPDGTVVFTADLSAAFAGKLSSGGPDENGTAELERLQADDWVDVEWRQGWGRDGGTFPDPGQRGPCTAEDICRLWDFGLVDGAAPQLQDRFALPVSTDVLRLRAGRTERILDHATERLDGAWGDGDLRCDGGEDCVLTPNIGAYQGAPPDAGAQRAASTGFNTDPGDRTPHVEDVDLYLPGPTGIARP